MPQAETQTTTLTDGRTLGFAEFGDPAGTPLFHFHGHPGSRLEGQLLDQTARRVGVRVLAVDRPGIGLSTYYATRSILDWPQDVLELAEHLDLSGFAVQGVSGGAPYAAACACAIPQRLIACGLIAGLGPIDRFGTAGMMALNRVGFAAAYWLPWLLRPALWLMFGRLRKLEGDTRALAELGTRMTKSLPPPDREAAADPATLTIYMREVLEAFRQGARGAAQDARLYVRDWGFRLEDIRHPAVHLWHGEHDVNVPVAMGRAVAAAIPECRARFLPDDAHLSVALRHQEEILRALKGENV